MAQDRGSGVRAAWAGSATGGDQVCAAAVGKTDGSDRPARSAAARPCARSRTASRSVPERNGHGSIQRIGPTRMAPDRSADDRLPRRATHLWRRP